MLREKFEQYKYIENVSGSTDAIGLLGITGSSGVPPMDSWVALSFSRLLVKDGTAQTVKKLSSIKNWREKSELIQLLELLALNLKELLAVSLVLALGFILIMPSVIYDVYRLIRWKTFTNTSNQ